MKFTIGVASGTEGHGRAVRHQDTEEGHHHPRRGRRLRHGREAGVSVVNQASVPRATALLFPNYGPIILCHGVCERGRSDVPDTAMRQIQRAGRSVSGRLK